MVLFLSGESSRLEVGQTGLTVTRAARLCDEKYSIHWEGPRWYKLCPPDSAICTNLKLTFASRRLLSPEAKK